MPDYYTILNCSQDVEQERRILKQQDSTHLRRENWKLSSAI
jgi:hypothetical protein